MGVCVCFQSSRKLDHIRGSGMRGPSSSSASASSSSASSSSSSSSSTIKVIQVDGRLKELKHPIKASAITSQNPNCFLCSSELMSVGSCPPQIPSEEDLQSDQIYFLIPLTLSQTPLSLHHLCALAVKASAALPKDAAVFRLSSHPPPPPSTIKSAAHVVRFQRRLFDS